MTRFILLVLVYIGMITSGPAFAAVSLNDIQSAIIQEDFQKAQESARSFIAQKPRKEDSDQAQYYLGLSLLRTGKILEAKEIMHQLIRYKPSTRIKDLAQLVIIDAHYMEEHFDEVLKDGRKLLKKRPSSEFESLIYLKLARANLRLANWDQARAYLNKIIEQFPNSPEIHIANQLMDEKQFFAVQVGSFLNKDRAEKILSALKENGEYAYIIETIDEAGREFYRVRVGKMSRLKDAKELELKLSDLGYPTRIYP